VVNRPTILLADEPAGNLDTSTGREIMPLLGELNGKAMTIIMVTHSPEWARYTHRILHISDGRPNGEETNSAPLELAAAEFSKPGFSAAKVIVS